ncbi:MAG: hypothetical protein ACREEM_06725 [Blastocatellia bacterium]
MNEFELIRLQQSLEAEMEAALQARAAGNRALSAYRPEEAAQFFERQLQCGERMRRIAGVEDIPEEIRSQIGWRHADALSQLALAEMMLWRLDDAQEHNARAVAEYRQLEENEKALAVALRNRACMALLETRFAEAEALLDEAASLTPRNRSA